MRNFEAADYQHHNGNPNFLIRSLLKRYDGVITGLQDLIGDDSPSVLFYILARHMSYLLNPQEIITDRNIQWRRKIYPLVKKIGPHFLANPQMIENRFYLRNPMEMNITNDPGITLPDEPVIWAANHGFKDDVLATILVARHSYLLFGSLPQFYNTFDGVIGWLIGSVMVNRKIRSVARTSVEKMVSAMRLGTDCLMCPEGVWNKTPNVLVLDLWPGIYRIACETGAKVVPVVHYIRDCNNETEENPIHTVIDDPIQIDNLSEKAALELIRDTFATWYYLMMEAYGQASRKEALNGSANVTEAWECHLQKRVKTTARYDREIELCADYRSKDIVRPEQVWRPIAEIHHPTTENLMDVAYAKKLLIECAENDFQRRF